MFVRPRVRLIAAHELAEVYADRSADLFLLVQWMDSTVHKIQSAPHQVTAFSSTAASVTARETSICSFFGPFPFSFGHWLASLHVGSMPSSLSGSFTKAVESLPEDPLVKFAIYLHAGALEKLFCGLFVDTCDTCFIFPPAPESGVLCLSCVVKAPSCSGRDSFVPFPEFGLGFPHAPGRLTEDLPPAVRHVLAEGASAAVVHRSPAASLGDVVFDGTPLLSTHRRLPICLFLDHCVASGR